MYMLTPVSMHICVNVNMHAHLGGYVFMYLQVLVYVYISKSCISVYAHMFARMQICFDAFKYFWKHLLMCKRTCSNMCICMCIHVHVHKHTCAYMYGCLLAIGTRTCTFTCTYVFIMVTCLFVPICFSMNISCYTYGRMFVCACIYV